MTTIRYTLQQEVFEPAEERLLAACHVGKLLKKKKSSFLCIVSKTGPPVSVTVVQIKQSDKSFKRKRSWTLAELKVVDGKSEDENMLEFDLHFDKVYRWIASSAQERHLFVIVLYKNCTKHVLHERTIFKNLPTGWVTEDVMTPESKFVSSPLMDDNDLTEDFQAITDKEQEDLNRYVYTYVHTFH